MSNIITIHEYILKPNVDAARFEEAVRTAQERKLFDLPGLIDYHFLKGIKGTRCGHYTAIWIYANRQAWEALWGPPEQPRRKHEYPATWLVWEDGLLAPLLTEEPDQITFTAYEELLMADNW